MVNGWVRGIDAGRSSDKFGREGINLLLLHVWATPYIIHDFHIFTTENTLRIISKVNRLFELYINYSRIKRT